ncbi:hypothetical protein T4A_13248 [Trichinella pseudospiralis]|uniref:Uncharacterized protein n=1 Tax=Trichinella pseudospiralis TaxID=6337 RepID=A0A0V1E6K7_TRIPS|nr:hypothetical protein T4A_13248 [Trichinella pseudospiralis]
MRAIETLALAFIGIAGGTGGAAGDCLHFAPDETGKKIGMSSAVLVEMHIKHTNEPLPSKVAALIDWLHQFGIKRKKQVSFETAEQEGRGSESEQANESVCDHLVLDLNQLNGGQNYFKVEQVTSLYEQQQH